MDGLAERSPRSGSRQEALAEIATLALAAIPTRAKIVFHSLDD